MAPMRTALVALLLVSLAGCDLFGGGDGCLIEARGRAVSPETGVPVAGLGVTLSTGTILNSVVDEDRTGSDGAFFVTHDTRRSRTSVVTTTGYLLTINDRPFDSRYTLRRETIYEAGECSVDLGDVEIGPNPLLP